MLNKKDVEIAKLFDSFDRSQNNYAHFQNFIQIAAISIANQFYSETELGKTMEEEYMQIIKQYSKKDVVLFPEILGLISISLNEQAHDCLGEVFMQGNFGSKQLGQFFTPFHISEFMAQINIGDIDNSESFKKRGWFSMSEPACGSGGMVIAVYKTLKANGLVPAEAFWCEARDISTNSFYMTYIQLSLLGISARVVLGDTLAMEERRVLYTPAFITNNWFEKIESNQLETEDTETPINIPLYEPEQLEVFANGTLF